MTEAVPNLWARHCEAHTKDAVQGEVIGDIPAWLNGRLIRNGPGGKCIGESYFNHLFDGMAVLHMVNIEDGKVSYTSRYLESTAYTMNHRANRILVSEFGTLSVPDPCISLFSKFSSMFLPAMNSTRGTDNCSVNVLQIKDELIAMAEMDEVRIVDLATLDTKEKTYKYSHHVSIQRATAHPHVEDGIVYNLGFSATKGPPRYCIISLPEGQIEKAKIVAEAPSRWKFNPAYMHSFGMTENYFILAEGPLAFDVLQMLRPKIIALTPFQAMKYYKNENTKFRILSRKTGKELTTNYFAPDFFNFHYMNCFEANGCIVLDVCATDDNIIGMLDMVNINKIIGDPMKSTTNVEPRRYVLPIDDLEMYVVGDELLKNVPEAKISREDLLACASAVKLSNGDIFVKPVVMADTTMELPRINYKYNTKPYTYSYGVRVEDYKENFFDFDCINKLNVQTGVELIWQDKDFYTSEPVFVAQPVSSGEDDGVIITILLHKTNHRKLALLVLDAVTLTETARVNFCASGTVTPSFHGQFIATGKENHNY